MHVRIDGKVFTSFPQVPQIGTRVRINGAVHIITEVIVEPGGEFECTSTKEADDAEKTPTQEVPGKRVGQRKSATGA